MCAQQLSSRLQLSYKSSLISALSPQHLSFAVEHWRRPWCEATSTHNFFIFTMSNVKLHVKKKANDGTRQDWKPCSLSRSLPTWNNVTNIMVAIQWSCDPPYRTCWKNMPRSLSRERTVLQSLTPPASNGPPLHTHFIHSLGVDTAVMFCM